MTTKKPIDLERLKTFVELAAKGETTNVGYIYASVPDLISALEEAKTIITLVAEGRTKYTLEPKEWLSRFKKDENE